MVNERGGFSFVDSLAGSEYLSGSDVADGALGPVRLPDPNLEDE